MPEINKKVWDELKLGEELSDLRHTYERESEPQYRAVVERDSELRSLVKGDPADWFSDEGLDWHAWSEHRDQSVRDAAPRYNHNINLSKGWWEILQSAMQTAGVPGSTFRPQNSDQPKDREAAEKGTDIIDYQRTIVDFAEMLIAIYRLFYTDGICLAYTRHVKDGAMYGMATVSREVVAPAVTRDAGYECPDCGFIGESEVSLTPLQGEEGGVFGKNCPDCEQPLFEEYRVPERMEDVTTTVESEEPRGRELVDLYGALESFLPWWAKDLEHAPYAAIRTGVPKEDIIGTFIKKIPNIDNLLDGTDNDTGKLGMMERENARAPAGSSGNTPENGFVTYSRWWFRPQCFYKIANKQKRAELLRLFPTGVFCQFAGDVYLDAIEEKLEEKLVLMRPLKGDGMYTPSIGQSGVPIHKSFNTAWNMALEAMEHCAFAQGLLDDSVHSGEGINDTKVRPGTWKLMNLQGGKKLRDSWDQMKSEDISQSVQSFIQSALPMGEFLVGAEKVLQGGPITNVRTLGGQAQARSQALQRQAPAYQAAKVGLAGIQERMVNEFLQNQTAETYYEVTGDSGDMEQRKIELKPERGKVFAYPELSESIPQTWAQTQDSLQELLATQNEQVKMILASPRNARVIFDALGQKALTVPTMTLCEKYERYIVELMAAAPIEQEMPGQPTIDETGQQIQGEPTMVPGPSIAYDPVLDDPAIARAVIMDWAAGKSGMAAQRAQPGTPERNGFDNVRLFAEAAMHAQMQAEQAAAQAAQPQGAAA